MNAEHICAAVILRWIQIVHMEDINGIAFIPIETVVIGVSSVPTVGGRGFTRGSAAMERPAFGDGDFYFIAVLVTGSRRAE